jgi:hypothetical protein
MQTAVQVNDLDSHDKLKSNLVDIREVGIKIALSCNVKTFVSEKEQD